MAHNSPPVRRRRLGHLLRDARSASGLTARQVGDRLDRSETWILRVERGNVGIRRPDLRAVLELYGITDPAASAELEELARAGRERGWWSQYASVLSSDHATLIGFEQSAQRLLVYEALVVHGLFQTEGYARAAIRASNPTATDGVVDRLVQVRLRRQERLEHDPRLEIWAVFDEAVLRRVIGGDVATHLVQLDRLLVLARRPSIRVQVLPFSDSSHPGMAASFTGMEFPEDDPIVFIEGITGDTYEQDGAAQRYFVSHENMRASALSEARSIALIEWIRDEVAT